MNKKSYSSKPAPSHAKCCCHKCDGTGYFGPDANPAKKPFCDICQGAGSVTRPVEETTPCGQCSGTGKTGPNDLCHVCCATGRLALDPSAPFNELPTDPREGMNAREIAIYDKGLADGLRKAASTVAATAAA